MKKSLLGRLLTFFAIIGMVLTVNDAYAVKIKLTCGSVGDEFKLCKEQAEKWAKQTNNEVELMQLPPQSNKRLGLIQQIFKAKSDQVDVVAIDVTWPGLLAEHFVDLNRYFSNNEVSKHLSMIVQNNTVADGKLVAMPYTTDVGILYYRKDLLEKYKRSVPKTWSDLEATSKFIVEQEQKINPKITGYVWQGKASEELTSNVLEWIDSHRGGTIIDNETKEVIVNTPRVIGALNMAVSWIGGISPKSVLNYSADDTHRAFVSGNAIFMRNWSYSWALLNRADSPLKGKVGTTSIPTKGATGKPTGTLAGSNLGISKYSKHPAVAADLIKYLSTNEAQLVRALSGSYNPTIEELYRDPRLVRNNETQAKLLYSFINAVTRPSKQSGSAYAKISELFWNGIHEILKKNISVEEGLKKLEVSLNNPEEKKEAPSAGFPLLSLIIFSPVLGLFLSIVFQNSSKGVPVRISCIFSSLVTLGLSIYLLISFDSTFYGFQFIEKVPWIETFGVSYFLAVDGFNLFFVLVSAFLMPMALLASWKTTKLVWQFHAMIMALQIGICGAFLALDVLMFYVFFEVMLIPLYFMVGIWGGKNRIYAATKFFIYTMAGSLLMLASLIYTAILHKNALGYWSFSILDWYNLWIPVDTQMWLFLGFALAFCIKIPLFPFHTWLPDAHYEAPTLGSVELAGLLLKLGPYGFIRFVLPLFPDAAHIVVPFIIILGLMGIIYGGLVAMVQTKLKKLIAYSSVAHMGYIVLGMFVFNMEGMGGSLIQMINHAIVTGALFLCVGILYERTNTQEISEYGGVIHKMPIFAGFFLFFTLASIGLPGLNGFIGEALIMLGAAKLNIIYAIIAAFGVVIAAIYMLWMYQRVMFGKVTNKVVENLKDLNLRETFVLIPLAVITLFLGVYPQPFFDKVNVTLEGYLQEIEAEEFNAQHQFNLENFIDINLKLIFKKESDL